MYFINILTKLFLKCFLFFIFLLWDLKAEMEIVFIDKGSHIHGFHTEITAGTDRGEVI